MSKSFEAASRAAEAWLTIIAKVAEFGSQGNVDPAFDLLIVLQELYDKHGEVLRAAWNDLAAISDAPVEWGEGRGWHGITPEPGRPTPHVWSSAHEAAEGMARVTLSALVDPLAGIEEPDEQRKRAKALLAERWKALTIPADQLARLEERVRRERAKLLAVGKLGIEDTPDVPLREQVLDVLTEQQRKVVEYLWDRKSGASFDTITTIPGAFQHGSSQSDDTVKDKVKAIRNRLDKSGLPVTLEVSGRRLKLILPPG